MEASIGSLRCSLKGVFNRAIPVTVVSRYPSDRMRSFVLPFEMLRGGRFVSARLELLHLRRPPNAPSTSRVKRRSFSRQADTLRML